MVEVSRRMSDLYALSDFGMRSQYSSLCSMTGVSEIIMIKFR